MTTRNDAGASPRVSVIVIFLDAARFLTEAIESVIGQTFADWELLLVDDGSNDGSTELALEYAHAHPRRIRYLTHPGRENRGMSASRNLGIREARGEFVAFLDADDVWFPEKLEQQVRILDSQPRAALVYGRSVFWYSWSGPTRARGDQLLELGVEPNKLVEPPTLLTLALESKAQTASMSNVLVRRRSVERVGGSEEAMRGLFEDQAFLAKLCVAEPVFVAGEVWDRYRQHDASCVARTGRGAQKYARGLVYFDWLEQYLVSQHVADERLWRALRKKRRRYRHPHLHRLLYRVHRLAARRNAHLRTIAGRVRQRIGPREVAR
jgi:glycosyltransferase involved in cell wall biosynthesis